MKKILLPLVFALTLSACSSMFEDEITINSDPKGALVLINDEIVGITPLTISLPNDGSYEVVLIRDGYKNKVMNVSSIRDNPFVKFGPLVDTGYYKSLKVPCSKNEMQPEFLPAFKGTKAFEDMQKNLDKVDQMKKDGKITACEHSYMIKKIIEFYSEKSAK